MWYGGLDAHKSFVQACFMDEKGQVVREGRFDTSPTGLRRLCDAAFGSRCVVEASTSCFPVFDALQESGIRVRVAHPSKVKAIAYAKLKTDKVDARMLAHLERADLVPEAHVPSKFTRELKELVRQHVSLTQERTRDKSRVKALLLKNGVRPPFKKVFTRKGEDWLLKYTKGVVNFALEQAFQRMKMLKEQRKAVDLEIEKHARLNSDAVLLKTMPGVGWFSALLLAVEIDGVQRFADEEHLQSYAGLVPSIRQSGSVSHSGHLSKQGNSLMRWTLVQDAWVAVRRFKRFRKVFMKTSRKHGPKVAIVAVARKMLRCAFFMLSRRQAFNENA